MRVVVHDYSGHPFQAQLSRALAGRGHEVDHVSCGAYVSGKGDLRRRAGDPPGLSFSSISMPGGQFAKYNPGRRLVQELGYARSFVRHLAAMPARPDALVMCNVPLLAHAAVDLWCRRVGLPVVFWHQDVYSSAMARELRRRLGVVGRLAGSVLDRLEGRLARGAAQVVVIAPGFLREHRRWGVRSDVVTVIPNWAPLEEIPQTPRDNAWAVEHGLVGRPTVLYAGTLGLKHNPQVLVDLMELTRKDTPDVTLVVVSEGPGADHVAEHAAGLDVTVLPFQPFDRLAEVLGAADVLTVILEEGASEYSVPSKTLSYLCAGRPVLALMPASNPAFPIVAEAGGLAYDLGGTDLAEVAKGLSSVLSDPDELAARGARARRYAETAFDIERIAGEFETVLSAARRAAPGA